MKLVNMLLWEVRHLLFHLHEISRICRSKKVLIVYSSFKGKMEKIMLMGLKFKTQCLVPSTIFNKQVSHTFPPGKMNSEEQQYSPLSRCLCVVNRRWSFSFDSWLVSLSLNLGKLRLAWLWENGRRDNKQIWDFKLKLSFFLKYFLKLLPKIWVIRSLISHGGQTHVREMDMPNLLSSQTKIYSTLTVTGPKKWNLDSNGSSCNI